MSPEVPLPTSRLERYVRCMRLAAFPDVDQRSSLVCDNLGSYKGIVHESKGSSHATRVCADEWVW